METEGRMYGGGTLWGEDGSPLGKGDDVGIVDVHERLVLVAVEGGVGPISAT